jgi:hypothetical protein
LGHEKDTVNGAGEGAARAADASPARHAGDEARWYYRKGLGKAGPVTTSELTGLLLDKRIGPSTLVTRADRSGWRPPEYWPEFEAVVADLARSARPPYDAVPEFHLRRLRGDCLAMFALLLAVVMMLAAHATGAMLAGDALGRFPIFCFSCILWLVAAGSGIYAIFFLRRTWRYVAALPAPIAGMGFVGAFGLIVLAAATIVIMISALGVALF